MAAIDRSGGPDVRVYEVLAADRVRLETPDVPRRDLDADQRRGELQDTGGWRTRITSRLRSVRNAELFTEFEIAFRNGLLMREQCRGAAHLCNRVGAMLYRLHQSLDP